MVRFESLRIQGRIGTVCIRFLYVKIKYIFVSVHQGTIFCVSSLDVFSDVFR